MATKTRHQKAKPRHSKHSTLKTPPAVIGEQTAAQNTPIPLPWLTVEIALAGLVAALAIGLRLWRLAAYPLSDAEAAQSLTALALYRGDTLPTDPYSPLMTTLATFNFLLFGDSTFSARLGPALLGVLLALLPLTLRRQLGRRAALMAAFLLATSPTALYLSRTVNAEIGVAAGALMAVAGFFNWADDHRPRWLYLLAVGLATLIAAGPMTISVLLIFAMVFAWRRRETLAMLSPVPPASPTDDGAGPPSTPAAAPWRNAGLLLVGLTVVLATAGTFNLPGFGQIPAYIEDWLGRFGLQTLPRAGFNAVFLLTIYEPLMVVAGLVGLTFALLRRTLIHMTLVVWFVGLLALDLLMGGRPNGHVILLVSPLALLAASALERLWLDVRDRATWDNEGLLLAAGLVISGFTYIGLTGWLVRFCAEDDTLCRMSWVQPVAAIALLATIAIFFGFLSNFGVSRRGLALTGVVVGLLMTTSFGWRLNYGPLRNLPYQPLAGLPPATGLVTLKHTLNDLAMERSGDLNTLDTTLVGVDSPALRWQLRHYRHLTKVNSLRPDLTTNIIITPLVSELGSSQGYLGQDFQLNAYWSPVGLPLKEFVTWLVYRQVHTQPPGDRAILWLRVE